MGIFDRQKGKGEGGRENRRRGKEKMNDSQQSPARICGVSLAQCTEGPRRGSGRRRGSPSVSAPPRARRGRADRKEFTGVGRALHRRTEAPISAQVSGNESGPHESPILTTPPNPSPAPGRPPAAVRPVECSSALHPRALGQAVSPVRPAAPFATAQLGPPSRPDFPPRCVGP